MFTKQNVLTVLLGALLGMAGTRLWQEYSSKEAPPGYYQPNVIELEYQYKYTAPGLSHLEPIRIRVRSSSAVVATLELDELMQAYMKRELEILRARAELSKPGSSR